MCMIIETLDISITKGGRRSYDMERMAITAKERFPNITEGTALGMYVDWFDNKIWIVKWNDDIQDMCDSITHEYIHWLLYEMMGEDVSYAFDNLVGEEFEYGF